MKYTYNEGIGKQRSYGRGWLAASVVGLFIGGYALINTLYPTLPAAVIEGDAVAQRLLEQQPDSSQDRLYIPQIGVDTIITTDKDAGFSQGAIQRVPENGNPHEGGNFIVAARHFHLALTPVQTRQQSPFYHLDKLSVGEQIYVDYDGKRYAYEIQEKRAVGSDVSVLEDQTEEPRLTLYAFDVKADQQAIIAKQIGTVAWVNGQPKLKSL